MGWVRIDDNFADHPKVIALTDSAFRTYITALCYANRQLTDGFIPQAVYDRMAVSGDSVELVGADLWQLAEGGWLIRSYTEYQPTKSAVNHKREQARERLKRFREKGNANETEKKLLPQPIPNPTQPIPNPNIEKDNYNLQEIESEQFEVTLPRIKSAQASVERISNKLAEARLSGVNAWNLSKLIEEEWDLLHNQNDIGGCIALTAWYVSELQSRKLTSSEIGRIGQMTKRFGRIALLAIDEAAAKDLNDLVSYAYRVAQRMYADRKARSDS